MTMRALIALFATAAVIATLLAACQMGTVIRSHALDPEISIGENDLGGVVTSANGPEAGVWVIAETTDLPTKFAKIVVTDERGRYRDPRSAESELQRVGARLRAHRFAEGAQRAGQAARSEGGRRAHACRGRRVLPGGVLVFDAEDSGHERVRAGRQRRGRRRSAARPSG